MPPTPQSSPPPSSSTPSASSASRSSSDPSEGSTCPATQLAPPSCLTEFTDVDESTGKARAIRRHAINGD